MQREREDEREPAFFEMGEKGGEEDVPAAEAKDNIEAVVVRVPRPTKPALGLE